jgi:hypothetical protein
MAAIMEQQIPQAIIPLTEHGDLTILHFQESLSPVEMLLN